MNKEQISAKIKETEEQLAKLRAELEKPEYPSLAEAKAGDMLEDQCIVVHKFSDVRMALIAAPYTTEALAAWSKEFLFVFDMLHREGLNNSQWFIPNIEQLGLAHKNCRSRFSGGSYWSSTEDTPATAQTLHFKECCLRSSSKSRLRSVRAFSLVSY